MNFIKQIGWLLSVIFVISCTSQYEAPAIQMSIPFEYSEVKVIELKGLVRRYAERNNMNSVSSGAREDVLGSLSFDFLLTIQGKRRPGISIVSVSETDYFRVMFFEKGFSSKDEMMNYKKDFLLSFQSTAVPQLGK